LNDFVENCSKFQGSQGLAQTEVLKEFRAIWCTLNVYPKDLKNLKRSYTKLFHEFHRRVRETEEKRTPAWKELTKEKLNLNKLDWGVDLICTSAETRSKMEAEWGVKMETRDFEFYEDNCVPKEGKCPRKMFSTSVDKEWLVRAQKSFERWQAQERREMKERGKLFSRRSWSNVLPMLKSHLLKKTSQIGEFHV
jgi:hypothetical protein